MEKLVSKTGTACTCTGTKVPCCDCELPKRVTKLPTQIKKLEKTEKNRTKKSYEKPEPKYEAIDFDKDTRYVNESRPFREIYIKQEEERRKKMRRQNKKDAISRSPISKNKTEVNDAQPTTSKGTVKSTSGKSKEWPISSNVENAKKIGSKIEQSMKPVETHNSKKLEIIMEPVPRWKKHEKEKKPKYKRVFVKADGTEIIL